MEKDYLAIDHTKVTIIRVFFSLMRRRNTTKPKNEENLQIIPDNQLIWYLYRP